MEKKVKKVYHWYCDCFFSISNNPNDWFVDCVTCSECGFYLDSIRLVVADHPMKYCPGCGGYIDGVMNPDPPINQELS